MVLSFFSNTHDISKFSSLLFYQRVWHNLLYKVDVSQLSEKVSKRHYVTEKLIFTKFFSQNNVENIIIKSTSREYIFCRTRLQMQTITRELQFWAMTPQEEQQSHL